MLNKIRQNLIEWNLFASEDQNDDMSSSPSREITNADAHLLREQRISTRLYVISLTTTSFILVISTLLSAEKNIITIHNPSLKVYKELQEKFSTTLNCPCLTNTMPYNQFIVVETAMHQICSSSFVSEQWISALFIPDASRYSGIDFRATASSQFELLKTLCEVARNNIFESLLNLNNTQLLDGNLLPENEIFIQAKTTSEQIRNDTTVRLNNALKLIELLTESNSFSSALNTNIVYFANRVMFHELFVYASSNTAWYSIVNNKTKRYGCQFSICFLPVGFYSFAEEIDYNRHAKMEPHKYNASDLVPGFFGACTPYEAIFQANFICLYDIKCIKKLTHYFPRLVPLMPTTQPLNTAVPSKYPRNVTVNHLLQEIFLEQWRVSIDHIRYFAACAPKICTYSYTKQVNIAYMITMLISLYGGLQTILRFIIPYIVHYSIKRRSNVISHTNTNQTNQTSIQKRIIEQTVIYFNIWKKKIINWNLFKSIDRSSEAIHQQRLSTRLYLCCLIVSVFILLLLTTISEQTISLTYDRPPYSIYKKLYKQYSEKLICSCSEITPSYGAFLNITPIYHPICSSAFIKPIWFNQLEIIKGPSFVMTDWRVASLSNFQSLAALCTLAHDIISNDIELFRLSTIVTTRLLNSHLFSSQMNNTLEELIHSMQTEFERVNHIFRLIFQVNQYFSGTGYNSQLHISGSSNDEYLKIKIFSNSPGKLYEDFKCLCSFNINCGEPIIIMHAAKEIIVPGFVWRCYPMDSILSSTLECFYSNTRCLTDILLHYINYSNTAVPVPPLNVSQLIRTTTHSTVATLADNLFVEGWKISWSHVK
ncbi:unnamed protein product [Rotaria socialis]|uniref:Uncharacterized protein n=1 Tax=Rotaria socialis TaxID=392032 RepID=A0A819Y9D9_9BILA|nr:unnamed protein product [Rotaria socialis]CAF4154989.1 unnamed protein product [Rotaria socialis]